VSLVEPSATKSPPEPKPKERKRLHVRPRLGWVLVAAAAFASVVVVNAFVVDNETSPGSAGSGQLIHLPGGALHVDRSGPVMAPAIVLLPGLAESSAFWSRVVPVLSRHYDVYRVDLLGQGLSDKPGSGYGITEQARAITALIGKLGLCRPLLVGHSLGGVIAVAAAQAPTLMSGVVLLDVPPRADTMNLPIAAHLATWPGLGELLHQIEPDWLIRQQLASALAPEHPVPDSFVRDFNVMTYESFKHLEDEAVAFTGTRPLDQLAAREGISPMVIFGREDRLVSVRGWSLWRHVAGSEFRIINGAGHDTAWEQPSEVSQLIAGFASQHDPHGCHGTGNPLLARRHRRQ